jgi:hypothetical protein
MYIIMSLLIRGAPEIGCMYVGYMYLSDVGSRDAHTQPRLQLGVHDRCQVFGRVQHGAVEGWQVEGVAGMAELPPLRDVEGASALAVAVHDLPRTLPLSVRVSEQKLPGLGGQ